MIMRPQSAAPQGTEQERELHPPPSPTACGCWSNCFPKITAWDRQTRTNVGSADGVQIKGPTEMEALS
ncbi:hypothetical protein MHYP_G00308680 [Metynnis hypsauchen]